MDRMQQLEYLIGRLLDEEPLWREERARGELVMPEDPHERFRMYRSLVNVRPPRPAGASYLQVEDEFLQGELRAKGVVTLAEVRDGSPLCADPGILLWQGDITRLAVDGIVNAANSRMLGCMAPCHDCIDNAIHTAAGVRLRLACDELMRAQGAPEPTGTAKITPGFNLPAIYVLHTVGPIVQGDEPTAQDCAALASSYRACLDLAALHGLASVAFCCISTGEFRFPKRPAAEIAVQTVLDWRRRARLEGRAAPVVAFDVFGDENYAIYQDILGAHHA